MVTWENYEEYMLLDADGELNESESKALQGFIAQHPELQREYAMLKATVLEPDEAITYAHKEKLLKKTGNVRQLPSKWWMYSAAASIAAIIVIASIVNKKDNIQDVAKVNPKPVQIATKTEEVTNTPIPAEDIHSTPVKPVTIKTINANSNTYVANKANKTKATENQNTSAPIHQPLQILPAVDMEYEIAHMQPEIVSEPQTPVVGEPNNIATDKDNVFAILNKEKPAGITEFSNSISQKINKAKAIAQTIKSTDVVVRIGNRDLFNVQF
jgi:hypothetical protein